MTVAVLFPRDEGGVRLRALLWIGRVAVVFAFAANAIVTTRLLANSGAKYALFDWVIMPRISDNAYRELGDWFARNARPGTRIALAEFGQLHYYSSRDIVDALGLVSAGAARRLAAGDAIWTYERYRPQWIVETSDFRYFVDPTEYDWFPRAYRQQTTLLTQAEPHDPHRSRFVVYRRIDADAIPPPAELDARTDVLGYFATRTGIAVHFPARRRGPNGCRIARARGPRIATGTICSSCATTAAS